MMKIPLNIEEKDKKSYAIKVHKNKKETLLILINVKCLSIQFNYIKSLLVGEC